jgi:integrase
MWQTGVPRSLEDRAKISDGLKRLYSQPTRMVRVRNHLPYVNAYGYDRRIRYLSDRITASNMPEGNKRILKAYRKYLSMTTCPGNVYNNVRAVFKLLGKFERSFNSISEKDVMRIYSHYMGNGFSDYTKFSEMSRLKHFVKWLNGGETPKYFEKVVVRKKRRVHRNVFLDDIRKFIKGCESEEERAFFATLWEGCFSTIELLKVRMQDIIIRDGWLEIYVESKDRNRVIPILRRRGKMFPLGSYSLLRGHLENKRPGPTERIWSMEAYSQVRYRVWKIRNKIGLPHIRSHSFRKSRATYNDYIGMSTIQVAVFGGWEINSRTLNHYISTSGLNLIPKLQELNRN